MMRSLTRRTSSTVALLAAVLLTVMLGAISPSVARAQAADDPVDAPGLAAMQASLDAVPCPEIGPFDVDERAVSVNDTRMGSDGRRQLGETATIQCSYRSRSVPDLGLISVRYDVRLAHSQFRPCEYERTAVVERGLRRIAGSQIVAGQHGALRFDVPVAITEVHTQVVGNIEPSWTDVAESVAPLARSCQVDPVAVTCPEVAGLTLEEPSPVRPDDYFSAQCSYRNDEGARAQLSIGWASPQSVEHAIRQGCAIAGEPIRDTVGWVAHGTRSAFGRWLGTATVAASDLRGAVDRLIDQVADQAAPCEGVAVEPAFTPLPDYLASIYTPERVAAPAFVDREALDEARAAAFSAAYEAANPPPTTPTSTTADSSATTTPATGTVAPSTTLVAQTGDRDEAGLPAWQRTLFLVVSIVAIILSILGVALALITMRRPTRVRPLLDYARLAIIVTVLVATIALLSRGAPLWAVAVALLLGGTLGWVQGSRISITRRDGRLVAQRASWALVAFVASIVVVQLASWLNRAGAISIGIALSFLSAALTAGTIAGRRPALTAARTSSGIATAVVLVVLAASAALLVLPAATGYTQDEPPTTADTAEPSDDEVDDSCASLVQKPVRCAPHELLIDLVDWTEVSFNGGLLAFDKPPIVVEVPRGISTPPEPISRTVEWDRGRGDEQIAQSVTETFTFDLKDDGFCCSIAYQGEAIERFTADGEPIVWEADGTLFDLNIVGETGLSGPFLGLGGVVGGVPFGEQRPLEWGDGGEGRCGRYVAESVANMNQEATFTTLTRDGETIPDDDRTVDSLALASMWIPCDVPGYSLENAITAAPPAPDVRNAPCPLRRELIPTLAEGGLPVTANSTIGEMYVSPNEALCSGGSLIAPVTFGDGTKGGQRSELAFQFGPIDEQTVWGDDSVLFGLTGASSIADHELCPLAADGRPQPDPDTDRCNYRSAHSFGEGYITVMTDQQTADGPNVTVRASMPWGSYYYRCHHCEIDDPEIERFLGSLHDFALDFPATLAAERADDDGDDTSSPATEGSTPTDASPTEEELLDEAERLGIDPDLIDTVLDEEGDGDPDRRAAAIAALVGLMGTMGLAGAAMAESGLSATEMATAFRNGGIDGLNDELDARARADAAAVVIDEYGDELRPGDDGLYEWDDGDNVRRVDRAELDGLIGRARGAQAATAADEAARIAEHDRLADADWETLRERVRTETAVEMAEIELEQAERQALFDRGIRLRDALESTPDSPLRERMLDFLERTTAPTDEQFRDLRDIMRGQESDQRIIDALDQRSEMTIALEGIQQDVARLAEMAGQPGLAWVIRNPSVPARLGIGYATGGLSEVALAPIDLWMALNDRADAVMTAENRDLTAAEITAEVAWAVAVEYIGARLGGAGAEPPPAPRRPMQLLPQNYIDDIATGQRIPLLHQTGYTPEHLRRLTNFAERNGVIPGARTANQYSAAHIRAGTALPKPLSVKPKSINELDLHLGARADHLGTVGFFEPKVPDTSKMTAELREQVLDRYRARLAEQSKYLDEITANPDLIIRDGRIFDAKTGKAFAGDMDLVYLKDATTGEVITGERYLALRDEMIGEDLVEHGAEFNIHADLTQGLTPGTDEYRAAIEEANKIVQNVLMPTHEQGALVMEIQNGVPVRGAPITELPTITD